MEKEQKLIFVLDDEENILHLLKINLTKAGFQVEIFDKVKKFFEQVGKVVPDLIILDIMLPEMDGYEVCKKLQHNPKTRNIPIIFLSAKSEEIDKVLGLELGGEDYITKPFSVRELIARVKVILRREKKSENIPEMQKVGNILIIDPEKYEVFVEGKKINLTTTEFKILHILSSNKGKVFSRDKLLDLLWGTEKAVIDRTIDVHIKNLKDKLGKAGQIIKNVRGVGYKIEE